MNQKLYIPKIVVVLSVLGSLLTGLTGYYLAQKTETQSDLEFRDFDKKRDEQFIREAFKGQDLYWLVENPEFDVDFMMDNRAPNRNHPEYIGKLQMKVLFQNGKPAGFTTYYMVNFYEGKIQFIYVHPNFRNKGLAGKLTRYDMDQLFKMGAYLIKMNTRVDNAPAIKVYERIGFKETSRDAKFIDYVIKRPK